MLHSTAALTIGLILAGVAIAGAVWALVEMSAKRPSRLQHRLSPYGAGHAERKADSDEERGPREVELTHTAILARAVALTGDFAKRQGLLEKVERRLDQADLPLRPAELLFVYGVTVVVLTALVAVITGSVLGALIAFLVIALAPPAALTVLAQRRTRAFLGLLPDTLQLLAGSLRAGFSLMQGVETVSGEVGEPMGKELRRVVTEARLGRELEDSLDAVAERMDSPDFSWAVMAIRIQREVGGNLSELLMTVADTMVARERLRREVGALTAEGRISAIIVGILPPVIGVIMMVINPSYMHPLFTESLGQIFLGLGVIGMVVGFLWMRKTVQIEI